MAQAFERDDIQGIIFSSYIKLPCAAYVLLRITNGAQAKTWLRGIIGQVTNGVWPPPVRSDTNLNIAFTRHGLEVLGIANDVIETFSFPFRDGMDSDRRARILGDTDVNAPAQWWWGNEKNRVHVILMLFGKDEVTLDEHVSRQLSAAKASGLEIVKVLGAGRQPDTKEHFGYNDGVGQPAIADTETFERQKSRTGHATALPAGEFMMSHEDVYGTIAPSPSVAPERDPNNVLAKSPDKDTRDLGYNGSYMVFRQLEQHVAQFWTYLDEQTRVNGVSNPEARDHLGAKMVGRWRSGTPLVEAPDRDTWTDPKKMNRENDFDYSKDMPGYACPIGSHIRRSNPRDSLGPDHDTAIRTTNRHRIMRRGRSYGHRLSETDPMPMVDDGNERGLHFICFNTDIERQFEFVQQTWLNNPQFGGLHDEVDPMVGDQGSCSGMFTVQGDPLRERIRNLCRFVTTRGGAYAFLPSIRALKWMAG